MTTNTAAGLGELLLAYLGLLATMWIGIAIAAGWLADQRGRSAVTWFLLGLVWGPFAALLVGLAPIGASGSYSRCPHCHDAIRRQAAVCPSCRTQLRPDRPDLAVARPPTQLEKLALLRDQGRITDAQYQRKAAEMTEQP